MTARECPSCGRSADLVDTVSIIDGKPARRCIACFDNSAEPIAAIVRVEQSKGWKAVPAEIRAAVRVWDGAVEDYVTIQVLGKRMLHRQLAVRPDPLEQEEENDLTRILELQRRIVDRHDPQPPRRKHWFTAVLAFFGFYQEMPA